MGWIKKMKVLYYIDYGVFNIIGIFIFFIWPIFDPYVRPYGTLGAFLLRCISTYNAPIIDKKIKYL